MAQSHKYNFIARGEGQPVILLNGQFMPISTWEQTIEDLQRWYRVIALEFPNQGTSPTYSDYNSMLDYSKYLLDFLDSIGISPDDAIVFGLSFGANIIRTLTLKMNVNLKAIIMGGISPISGGSANGKEYGEIYSLIENGEFEKFALMYYASVFSDQFKWDNIEIIQFAAKKLKENYEKRPDALIALIQTSESFYHMMQDVEEKYSCDIHIIAGKYDQYVDYKVAKAYAGDVNARFYTINGGHAFTVENNFDFMSILHDILRNYDP
ncbi:MAG: alpha/beta fold hydrolase [Solirubrobacterales bacterium]